jgi:hypothetical protein
MVLTILRTTGVVTLIAEDKVGGIFGSTTDENPEGNSARRSGPLESSNRRYLKNPMIHALSMVQGSRL